jgi:hypothetical protein
MSPLVFAHKFTRCRYVVGIVAGLALASDARGQMWNGPAGSQLWSTPSNWLGNSPPGLGGNVIFATATATEVATVNNMGSPFLASLTVNGLNPAGAWSISGSDLIVSNVSVASGKTLTMLAGVQAFGALTTSGGGTLALSAPSSANGATLTGGSLLVNTTLAPSIGGTVTVQTGATLGGAGGSITMLPVTIQNGGTLAPGNPTTPVSQLGMDTATIQSGGTYAIDIGSFSILSTVDVLGLSGALTLDPGSVVNVTNLAGVTPTDVTDRSYTIATASAINGATTGTEDLGQFIVGGADTGPVNFDATGFAAGDRFTLQRQGTTLVLTYTPVPEPAAALAVFAAGLGAYMRLGRRRAKVARAT